MFTGFPKGAGMFGGSSTTVQVSKSMQPGPV